MKDAITGIVLISAGGEGVYVTPAAFAHSWSRAWHLGFEAGADVWPTRERKPIPALTEETIRKARDKLLETVRGPLEPADDIVGTPPLSISYDLSRRGSGLWRQSYDFGGIKGFAITSKY